MVNSNPTLTTPPFWSDLIVKSPDWSGGAALEQNFDTGSVEELAGLDAGQWTVIGIDIRCCERTGELRVIAAPSGADNQLAVVDDPEGSFVYATEFLVSDVDPFDTLRAISAVLGIRLRSRRISDQRLGVVILASGRVPPSG